MVQSDNATAYNYQEGARSMEGADLILGRTYILALSTTHIPGMENGQVYFLSCQYPWIQENRPFTWSVCRDLSIVGGRGKGGGRQAEAIPAQTDLLL